MRSRNGQSRSVTSTRPADPRWKRGSNPALAIASCNTARPCRAAARVPGFGPPRIARYSPQSRASPTAPSRAGVPVTRPARISASRRYSPPAPGSRSTAEYNVCGRPTLEPLRTSRRTRPASSRRRRCGRSVFGCRDRRAASSRIGTGRPESRRWRYSRNRVSSASALWISSGVGSRVDIDGSEVRTYHGRKHGSHRGKQDNPGRWSLVTEEQIREALRTVLDPEIGKPIEDLGMLKDIHIEDGLVRVYVLITIEGCPLKDRITSDVTSALAPLQGLRGVDVRLSPISPEEREALVRKLRGPSAVDEGPRAVFQDGRTTVIAVASGEGGGVLDAVFWGFSVPRMLGVWGQPVGFNDMILPLESHGVKVISMGFFVP